MLTSQTRCISQPRPSPGPPLFRMPAPGCSPGHGTWFPQQRLSEPPGLRPEPCLVQNIQSPPPRVLVLG